MINSDIVERLRGHPGIVDSTTVQFRTMVAQRHEAADEIERLREALQAVVDDVLEYERINKLSPSPGKPDCWQSITNAKAALRPRERND